VYTEKYHMEKEPSNPHLESRESMPITMKFDWPTTVEKKLAAGIQSEDYADWDESGQYLVVTDGVTRDVYNQPGASPARSAAIRAAESIGENLHGSACSEAGIQEAFRRANQDVRLLNQEEGLWAEGQHNYLDKDLAGTCAACIMRSPKEFFYGYVGDCRVARISADGNLFITPDQVLAARSDFPKEGTREERAVIIRKQRRNNPSDPHKTYGVLTGEDTALDPKYLHTGHLPYQPGDILIVCSDGVAPFIEKDEQFRQLLVTGSREEIQQYVANPDSPYQNTDEKTLLLHRA
jgi:serine/threonine protein phosphatase PrpC